MKTYVVTMIVNAESIDGWHPSENALLRYLQHCLPGGPVSCDVFRGRVNFNLKGIPQIMIKEVL
jgi:hypothetical protein